MSHLSAYEEIERVASSSSSNADSDDGLRQLVDSFEEQYRINEAILLSSMNSRVTECTNVKQVLVGSRSDYLKFMYRILKKAAEVQTCIHKLKKRLEFMSKLCKGPNEYFSHLRGVTDLSEIYNSFLLEIVNRREFTSDYEEFINQAITEVSEMRRVETLRREDYIRKFGVDLPQMFLAIVPSIKEKPPFLNATLTSSQWLPEIEKVDLPAELLDSVVRSGKKQMIVDSRRLLELERENDRLRRELEALRSVSVSDQEQQSKCEINTTPTSKLDLYHNSPKCVVQDRSGRDVSRDFSLGAAMSALSSVVQMVEGNGIIDVRLASNNVRPFLSIGSDNAGDDIQSVLSLVQRYLDGISRHSEELQLLLANSRDEIENLSPTRNRGSIVDALLETQQQLTMSEMRTEPKISFRQFSVGDIALFCPVNIDRDIYTAFNVACPHRYLSSASLRSFRESPREGRNRYF